MPELDDGLNEIKPEIGTANFDKTLVNVYGQMKSISIDYGVMEKSNTVHMVKGKFDWNDVGSWEAVYQLADKNKNKNALVGNIYTEKTNNSYIYSPDKFTAVIGAENIIVIDTPDALLVCKRENVQDVKLVVDHLKLNKKTELI
jgi:mannose-1-phosphate guanylyltransferase